MNKRQLLDDAQRAARDYPKHRAQIAALKEDEERRHFLASKMRKVERRNRILSLVRNGASATQVSEILAKGDPARGIEPEHVSPTQVTQTVRRYLEKLHKEDALSLEQMRVLENERLDQLWSRVITNLNNPDGSVNLKAVDRLTRLSERRAKMNGLDAPQKHEHFLGNGLEALGLDEDHVRRAREAFLHAFASQGVPDVVVEGEAEEVIELEAGE